RRDEVEEEDRPDRGHRRLEVAFARGLESVAEIGRHRRAAEDRDEVLALAVKSAADAGIGVAVDDGLQRAAVIGFDLAAEEPLGQAIARRVAPALVSRPGEDED